MNKRTVTQDMAARAMANAIDRALAGVPGQETLIENYSLIVGEVVQYKLYTVTPGRPFKLNRKNASRLAVQVPQ